MPLKPSAEFLFETVGRPRHVQEFGARRGEQTTDLELRHGPAVWHDLDWLVWAGNKQEPVLTRQVHFVPSNPAFRHPRAAGHHILRSDAVLLIHKFSIVDRKSTRLNSSHGYISYAVFCLKK